MRDDRRVGFALTPFLALSLALFVAAPVQAASPDELVAAVVRIKTFINPEGQTVQSLGREREGSGIVIDEDGLVLTIGYLMVEAHAAQIVTNEGRTVPAEIVGYDHESGFGLLRATVPLKIKPLAFGRSADVKERDRVLVIGAGGADAVQPTYVVAKREFAGNWEYLLDEAIFTSPPHAAWSGAALVVARGQADRRRLADRRRCRRRRQRQARQHVRADRPPAADPRRPPGGRAHLRSRPAVARRHRATTTRGRLTVAPRHAGRPCRARRPATRRRDRRRRRR